MLIPLTKLLDYVPNPYPNQFRSNQDTKKTHSVHDKGGSSVDDEPRPKNELGLRLGQHWAVVGATGSGKTRFATGLLEYMRRQYPTAKRYVLDSTADGMAEVHAPIVLEGNVPPTLLKDAKYTQVWTPDTDDLDAYNDWLLRILRAREPSIVFVDEIASLGSNPLEGHIKLLKQGRKHGITVINLTQEIAQVPLTMFRQMSHYVQFRINADTYDLAQSRRFLAVTREEQRQPSAPFGFFYKHTSINSLMREFRSYQQFFGQSLN